MGIGALDMKLRCEKEFNIKLTSNDLSDLLMSGKLDDPPEGAWTDLQVQDIVRWVENALEDQEVCYEGVVFCGVQRVLMEASGAEKSEVTLDAWLVRDLGME